LEIILVKNGNISQNVDDENLNIGRKIENFNKPKIKFLSKKAIFWSKCSPKIEILGEN